MIDTQEFLELPVFKTNHPKNAPEELNRYYPKYHIQLTLQRTLHTSEVMLEQSLDLLNSMIGAWKIQ